MRLQKFEITNAEGGTAILMQVSPNSAKNEITGKDSDIIYVNLTSPAKLDAVDDDLQRFIAQKLGINRGRVAVTSGRSVEKKIVIVMGMDPNLVEDKLLQ